MTRKTAAALALISTLALACSTSDYDEPVQGPRGRATGDGESYAPRAGGLGAGLDILPPAEWWHDSRIAAPVNLSLEQLTALDKLTGSDEIAKLERDSGVAMREVRDLIDADRPTADAITAAGAHVRAIRDAMFDRQVAMLAAERTILTRDQWRTLEDQLQARRGENRGSQGYPRRGGRGGFGGRGRGPGWPY